MARSTAIASSLAVGVAAFGAFYALSRRRRRQLQHARAANAGTHGHLAAEDDTCAICLEPPRLTCMTNCGHKFCTPCFLEWWRRQPVTMDSAHVRLARCPLCTQEVTQIRPCFVVIRAFASGDSQAGIERRDAMRGLRMYNRDVYTTCVFRPIRKVLTQVRAFCNGAALTLYGFSGLVWSVVNLELAGAGGMWRIAPPNDERLRFICLWACITNICAAAAGGARGMPRLLSPPWLLDILVKLSALAGDFRHCELEEVLVGSVMLSNMRFASGVASVLRLSSSVVAPLLHDTALGPAVPHAIRLCELVELLADICAATLQLRAEVLGVRALLLLLRWRRSPPVRGRIIELLPIESWLLPIEARVRNWLKLDLEMRPECLVRSSVPGLIGLQEDVISWTDALSVYGVGLKALHVFHGAHPIWTNGLGGRREVFHGLARFPSWALADIRSLGPLSSLMATIDAATS